MTKEIIAVIFVFCLGLLSRVVLDEHNETITSLETELTTSKMQVKCLLNAEQAERAKCIMRSE